MTHSFKELPGVSLPRSWSSLEAAVARVFGLTETLTELLISCPLTELGGTNQSMDCFTSFKGTSPGAELSSEHEDGACSSTHPLPPRSGLPGGWRCPWCQQSQRQEPEKVRLKMTLQK